MEEEKLTDERGKQTFTIGKTPAVLYGRGGEEKAFLFVHGQGGNKEEAERFFRVAQPFGYAVLSVDLPQHGGRNDGADFLPWKVVPELQEAFSRLKKDYCSVSVYAVSIGAYFSLLAFSGEKIEKCLFVSPLIDMEEMICRRMAICGVTENRLRAEREIATPFGPPLSAEYLDYARSHPVHKIATETEILCASGDEVVPHRSVAQFALAEGCGITTIPGGEHYIHTENDVRFMAMWEQSVLAETGTAVAETERLRLRRMTEKDFPALCRILQDEQTMTAYEGAFSDEEVRAWLARQSERYRKWEFGLWAVVLKETGEMIGQCGLTMQPWKGREVPEIGYLFERRYWHRGYATEAAAACMRFAQKVLHTEEICCIIRDTNLPSQRVAERLGMKKADRDIRFYRGAEMPHDRYLYRFPTEKSRQ